jgi:ornithine cyclodeaminase/alanine dehydrogenase-like protein (mu-crystallin family)
MPLLLRHDDILASVTMADAIVAMEDAFREQGEGKVLQPQRTNIRVGGGFLRVGPAVLQGSGWMGFKAMNLCPGVGVRYMVMLYTVADGALVAMMDAQHLTTLRTGATSALATRYLARQEPTTVAVIGAGVEAWAQLEAMHALGLAKAARVHSRTLANRERFAREAAAAFEIEVEPCADSRSAIAGCGIVVGAVKSSETVLYGDWLADGVHVNSIGTARPDQREIDPATFTRSAVVVVDTREGVFSEAGDAIAAKDVFAADQAHELAELVVGKAVGRTDDHQVTLFKSVGTAIQDVGLAAMIYRRARERGIGQDLDDFPYAKPA